MDKEFVTIKQDPRYEINTSGDVRNKKTGRMIKSKRLQRDGYYHVLLGGYKQQKSYMTHRLVAEHFLPNPENMKYAVFKDHDKTNIDLSNLVWSNNPQYEGICKAQRRIKCITDGKTYKSISAVCRTYGICDLTVKHSCNTGAVVSGGLQFEFVDD